MRRDVESGSSPQGTAEPVRRRCRAQPDYALRCMPRECAWRLLAHSDLYSTCDAGGRRAERKGVSRLAGATRSAASDAGAGVACDRLGEDQPLPGCGRLGGNVRQATRVGWNAKRQCRPQCHRTTPTADSIEQVPKSGESHHTANLARSCTAKLIECANRILKRTRFRDTDICEDGF